MASAETMQAVLIENGSGPPSALHLGEAPKPTAGPGELLVQVHATALNRADTYQRKGSYPPPPGASPILGLEMAGTVAEVGEGVDGFAVGDRVCALLSGGGYAEYVAFPAAMAIPVPDNLGWPEAAGVPEAFLTAWQGLVWICDLGKGPSEWVLIHAGASGVGTAATQIAKGHGSKVIVTAGSQAKLDYCLANGADVAINYKEEDFQERVMEITDGAGADIIVDFVGASYWTQNLNSIALDGRMVLLGMMGGRELPEGTSIAKLMQRRARVQGSTLRTRTDQYKQELTADFCAWGCDRLANGTLRVEVDTVFPWSEAAAAHQHMEDNLNKGKIVLRVRDDDE